MVDLRRLMSIPYLRCQVASTMIAAPPPIPDGTCSLEVYQGLGLLRLRGIPTVGLSVLILWSYLEGGKRGGRSLEGEPNEVL